MAAPIVLVGTGTGIGKTHVGECILRILGRVGRRGYGYKPIESGVVQGVPTDASRLAEAGTFHVKRDVLRIEFAAPVSPHLAARAAGLELDLDAVRAEIAALSREADDVVVELPGGVFSPLTGSLLVGHFARSVPNARVLLVASDRLGVLHDIGSATRACALVGLPLIGLVLSAPDAPDASTGRNAEEIPLVTEVPYLATFPRGTAVSPFPEPADADRLLSVLTR